MFKEVFETIILGRGQENGGGPSLDVIIESADAHINNLDRVVLPLPESKPRTPFNSDVPAKEATMLNLTPRQKMRVAKRMVPLMLNMNAGAHV